MARRAEETENHWPGFVDVLSTIVMVVTFLLIILGIVIFVISKNISTELAASAQRVEEAQKALDEALAKAQSAEALVAEAKNKDQDRDKDQDKDRDKGQAEARQQAKAPEASPSRKEAGKTSKSLANAEASKSVYRASLARELTQNVKVDGKEKHAVRARKTDEVKQIAIARTEKETEPSKVRVTSSTAALSLLFSTGIKITNEASEQIKSYIQTKTDLKKRSKYEIRSFYIANKGSISEARRMAYYRALATRNQLIKLGIKAGGLTLKVANSSRPEDAGKVNIYLK